MEIRQEGVRLKHRWQELTGFSSFSPPQMYAAHSCAVPWKAIPATAADDKEIIIMRFYLQGYAEVLHLATTSRCLPPLPAGRAEPAKRNGKSHQLRRLWRAVRVHDLRQPAS